MKGTLFAALMWLWPALAAGQQPFYTDVPKRVLLTTGPAR